jgi:hypothetical protein
LNYYAAIEKNKNRPHVFGTFGHNLPNQSESSADFQLRLSKSGNYQLLLIATRVAPLYINLKLQQKCFIIIGKYTYTKDPQGRLIDRGTAEKPF